MAVGVIGVATLLMHVGVRVNHVAMAVVVLMLDVVVLVRPVRVRVGQITVRVLVTVRLPVGVFPAVCHDAPFDGSRDARPFRQTIVPHPQFAQHQGRGAARVVRPVPCHGSALRFGGCKAPPDSIRWEKEQSPLGLRP